MSLVRFATAFDLVDAFPTLVEDLATPLTEEEPVAFLKRLAASPTPEDAIAFGAYLLPRREAVHWAVDCVARLAPDLAPHERTLLDHAEAWTRAPSEEARQHALRLAEAGPAEAAATWVAFAVGWSGGSITLPPLAPVHAHAHLTAKAVRAAILIALAGVSARARPGALTACVEACLTLVQARPSA